MTRAVTIFTLVIYLGDAAGTPGTMLTFLPWPDLSGVPVLAVSGRYDPIIPMDEALQLVNLLRKAGAKVSESLGNAGHTTEATTVEIARRWLEHLTLRCQYLNEIVEIMQALKKGSR